MDRGDRHAAQRAYLRGWRSWRNWIGLCGAGGPVLVDELTWHAAMGYVVLFCGFLLSLRTVAMVLFGGRDGRDGQGGRSGRAGRR